MASDAAPEIQAIEEALNTLEQEARSVAAGLTEDQGTWRERPDSWSVSECLDHLATANEVYVRAMEPPAARAREHGSRRRRPALPGFVGGWFVRTIEPPVKPAFRGKGATTDQAAAIAAVGRRVATFSRVPEPPAHVPAHLRRHRPRWCALPQSLRARRPLQPCHRPPRDRGAPAAAPLAGEARARSPGRV